MLPGWNPQGRGCCQRRIVLQLRTFTWEFQNTQDPGLWIWVAYIAGDTLRPQPMGAGHVTLLQFTRAYGIPCPAMRPFNHSSLNYIGL